jgi:hypothetical protein
MDFSKLSDSDLQQIAKGDLRMVSENGLKLMAGEAPQDEGMFANLSYKNVPQNLGNLTAGLIRGAGSIGATILAPKDIISDAIDGKGLSLESNRARRKGMDEGLQMMGANPESGLYATGKIGGEIAGTAGLGNVIGGSKLLSNAPKLAKAIQSGGFTLGNTGGNAILNGATRVAGGAINGGVSAGVVDPESAGLGAFVGGAIPAVGKVGYETFKLGGRAIAPFTKAGRQKILNKNLVNMLGDDASNVASRLASAKGNTAGFMPSAGQVANNAELAAFERMFKNRNAGLFGDFSKSQSEALANAANGLGGDDLARINLVTARDDAVSSLYEAGQNAMIESSPQLDELLKRPAINQAYKAAELNAMNRGKGSIVDDKILSGTIYQDEAPQAISEFSRPDLLKGEKIGGGEGKNIIQQIRKMGGVNLGHIQDITGERTGRAAKAPVGFFNKNGLGVDDISQQLEQLGYIPKEEMRVDGGVQYVKDAIGEQLKGNKIYALGDEPFFAPNYYGTKTTQYSNPIRNDVGSYDVKNVYSGKTLQEVKFALDAAKKFNPSASTGERMTQKGLFDASSAFNNYLSDVVPEMRKADALFAEKSKPINQLDIGNEIRDRFIPARYRGDAAPLQFNRNALASILEDTGDTLAQKVTGFKGSTLIGEMSPKQYQTLQNIVKDNKLVDMGDNLGKGLGSPTYQHLAYNAKGEQSGLLGSLMGMNKIGRGFNAVRDFALTKPLQKMDADMAKLLQNPNTTGDTIQSYLRKSNAPKPAINAILEKYGLLSIPSVAIAQ